MQILAFVTAGGHPLFKGIDQILLQGLQTGHGHIKGTLLGDDGAGGVVGINNNDAVLQTGLCADLLHLVGDVMEGNGAVVGLQLETFFVNHNLLLIRSIPILPELTIDS